MALYHDATVTPSKLELASAWLAKQPWFRADAENCEMIGAFRFDDPQGSVGMETHLVRSGASVVQAPMTYRDAPLEGADDWLIGTTEHSTLGTRWVYDGLGDVRYLTMLAAVTMTGQGEALGLVEYDGVWHIAPTPVRIRGGGWGLDRVSVDDFVAVDEGGSLVRFQNDRFEMRVHRLVEPGETRGMCLTATWSGEDEPCLLADVVERQ